MPGARSAAPIPATVLPAMNMLDALAKAHIKDPTVVMLVPMNRVLLRSSPTFKNREAYEEPVFGVEIGVHLAKQWLKRGKRQQICRS